jgi:hypothetical protein
LRVLRRSIPWRISPITRTLRNNSSSPTRRYHSETFGLHHLPLPTSDMTSVSIRYIRNPRFV